MIELVKNGAIFFLGAFLMLTFLTLMGTLVAYIWDRVTKIEDDG